MNTRPPPPQGAPPSYTFVTKFYNRNLRPVVLGTSFVTAVWSIFSGIGFYRNIGPYNDNGAPSLAKLSIIIGSLYMGVFGIGVFGICAAASQKLSLIRIFAFLSALGAMIVAGISLFLIVIHFTMRSTILNACTNAATGQTYVYGGWWGPVYSGTLSAQDAHNFCQSYYDRDSWSLVIAFMILTGLGVFFSIIAFSYLRQMLDPSSPGNVIRDRQRSAVHPTHYNPPFDTPWIVFGTPGYNPGYYNYPAPAGPPPLPEYDGKPPGYIGDGWEDMQKKNHDEESGGPSGERDVASPRTGDPRY